MSFKPLAFPRGLASCIVAAVAMTTTAKVYAQEASETITFDDLPLNTVVTTQYTAQGMAALFSGNFVVNTDASNPANHVLVSQPLGTEFGDGSLIVTFLAPQHLVSLDGSFAAATSNTIEETLTAYDALGNLVSQNVVAQDGPRLVSGDSFNTSFSVQTTTDIIQSVILSGASISANIEIDNFHSEGEAPPPPSGAVAVQIVTPTASSFPIPDANLPSVIVSGTVTGTNIVSPATLSLDVGAPPSGAIAHTDQPLVLTQTSVGQYTFSQPVALPPGYVTLTATAQNIFGTSSSESIILNNLPQKLIEACSRTPVQGGIPATFNYAYQLPGCVVASCGAGAATLIGPAQNLKEFSSTIFKKWESIEFGSGSRLGPVETLGCPTSGEVFLNLPQQTPGRMSFEDGRIYVNTANTAIYVPGVFSTIIDASGDDLSFGVPDSDPTVGVVVLDVDTPWFQHFTRAIPNDPNDLGTTMELRGSATAPTLSVERQGGDLHEMTAAGLSPGSFVATLWEKYPCTGRGPLGPWTCQVAPPPQHNASNTQTDAHLNTECGPVGQLNSLPPPFPRSWPFSDGLCWAPLLSSVPTNNDFANFEYLGVEGWILPGGSHFSSEDEPTVHTCYDALTPPWSSDWNLHIRPFPAYDGLLNPLNFSTLDMEIETELCDLEWFFEATGFPRSGDLLFTEGRWIVDCAHLVNNEFHTEIHPQAIVSRATTVSMQSLYGFAAMATYQPTIVTGYFFQGPSTVSVYPPPRPSPDMSLEVIANGADGAFGGDKVQINLSSDHVDLVFTGPTAPPAVDDNGEMYNRIGQGYQGVVYAFWTP